MSDEFYPGQRWVSESEPELGVGTILRVTDRIVTAAFGASKENRDYARRSAPLRRVRFRVGSAIVSRDNVRMTVQTVAERNGLLFYRGAAQELCETDLNDAISFNEPEERLLAGQFDPPAAFDLRTAALHQQHQRRRSKVRGFVGGRIELIPHQLYIASEVSGRLVPRVLLSDEVGLGKTIEACLILHRLILTGRAQRVLILTPASLVHQWFVELLRRFNLWFNIFDEERCAAIEEVDQTQNPFLDSQLVLAAINLLTERPLRLEQALAAGWDLVIVDEAHHLVWSPEGASADYTAVDQLGRQAPGLLLLTATPEQLGMASHFARLRLLDPDRFFDLSEFLDESKHYREVARRAEAAEAGGELEGLLDRHGTGRVTFRNTRSVIRGFPERIVHLVPLDPSPLLREFDLLLDFIADLAVRLNGERALVICRTQSMVMAIEEELRRRNRKFRVGVFHEGLSLVQRDRNAAWFAEPHGAQLLICSEIGSEGRNFQFAHHLILFDIPPDPELIEQRIGRLDRIGQSSEIHVHAPFIKGSANEVFARWHHEGLDSLRRNITGARELFEALSARVQRLAYDPRRSDGEFQGELERLIADTHVAREEVSLQLHEGRDRLLEMNSFRPAHASELVQEVRRQDDDVSREEFMLRVFDHYSIEVEQLADRTYRLGSAGVLADSFPGLPSSGFAVTFDRGRALVREEIQFLTSDHPLFTGALDSILGSDKGNCSLGVWPDDQKAALYLESIFALECVAPLNLHIDRFLAPTPIRVVLDAAGKEMTAPFPISAIKRLMDDEAQALVESIELGGPLSQGMIRRAEDIARKRVPEIIAQARKEMSVQLEMEISRLRELQKVNRTVRDEEIRLLVDERTALDQHLASARLRLDAMRWIVRGG